MRSISSLLMALMVCGCSTNYVYKDRSETGNYSIGKGVSSFLVAHELNENITPPQVASASTTDGDRILFSISGEPNISITQKMTDDDIFSSTPEKPRTWSIRSTSTMTPSHKDAQSEVEENCLKTHAHPWDQAYQLFLCDPSNRRTSTNATETKQHSKKIVLVEPAFGYYEERYYKHLTDQKMLRPDHATGIASNKANNPKTTILEEPSPHWPSGGDISWHLEDRYTQLRSAQAAVKDVRGEKESSVKVAHLDSGYFPGDTFTPKYLKTEESLTCLPWYDNGKEVIKCRRDSGEIKTEDRVERDDETHGSTVLSVLAGGAIEEIAQNELSNSYNFTNTIGAFPNLRVAEYRITREFPLHIFPTEMAVGIVTATDSNFDVISLSQGGFPSLALRDAVNYAYSHGTVIVAATGNFFAVPILLGLHATPSTISFPARFNRVLGVAGITEQNRSYGDSPCFLFCSWRWSLWRMKGSFGPASEMAGHTLSAYTPNITTSRSNKANRNAIQMDGEGVSYAVPQVAATAAMWLELHGKMDGYSKRDWRRAEGVYQALLQSAKKNGVSAYSCEKMGEGILQAKVALETIPNPNELTPRAEATIGIRWVKQLIDSWDLLRIPLDFLIHDGTALTGLSKSLKQMLWTEIQQVLHQSDEGSALLARAGFANNERACPSYKKPSAWGDVKEFLLSQGNISTFLRAALNQQ